LILNNHLIKKWVNKKLTHFLWWGYHYNRIPMNAGSSGLTILAVSEIKKENNSFFVE